MTDKGDVLACLECFDLVFIIIMCATSLIFTLNILPYDDKNNSRARKGGKEEENADYGGIMVLPSQQHVSPCVEVVEQGLGTRGLRISSIYIPVI